jgi:hypothetical protein
MHWYCDIGQQVGKDGLEIIDCLYLLPLVLKRNSRIISLSYSGRLRGGLRRKELKEHCATLHLVWDCWSISRSP